METTRPLIRIEITKWIILVISSLISFFLIIIMTNEWSIGTSADSAAYLAGARNIINGKGLSLLYDSNGNHLVLWLPWEDNKTLQVFPWPPLLPLVLSVFGFLKLNLIESARFLYAALFGANIFLIIFIIKKYLKSIFLMVFAAIYLISSRDMIRIHSNLWSEPLFIFLGLLGILFLIYFIEKKKILFLLIASLFFSLAFFTRTIGIYLIALSVVSVLLFSELKLKNKIIYSAISAFIGILPFFIWTLINRFIYDSSQTELIYHPGQIGFYTRMLDALSLWFIPNKTPEKVRVILIIVLIILVSSIVLYIASRNKKSHSDSLYRLNSKILGIFIFHTLLYLIALLSARHFFNIGINLASSRTLLPAFISIFVVFLFSLKMFLDFYNNKIVMKVIAYVFCGFLIATSFLNNNAIDLYRNGQGYLGSSWYQSETIKELKEFQQSEIPIYTNESSVIYLLVERSSFIFPVKYNTHSDKKNINYEKELQKTMEEIIEKDGILVFFDRGWGPFIKEEEAALDNRLYLYKDTADGAIFRVRN